MGKGRRKFLKLKFLQENPCCYYCKKLVNVSNSNIDHIIARTSGGDDEDGNLVLTCKRCNAFKGSMPVSKWLALLPMMIKDNFFDMSRRQRRTWRKNVRRNGQLNSSV